MQPHQQRVFDEARDLAEKVERLAKFFRTTTFACLDQAEQERLSRQLGHMADYHGVLTERIAAFGY